MPLLCPATLVISVSCQKLLRDRCVMSADDRFHDVPPSVVGAYSRFPAAPDALDNETGAQAGS